MKKKIKTLIQKRLASLASSLVYKHQPVVIGITGSVGKTSTRMAVYAVLKQKYRVRTADKNLNNEFGLPLSIVGLDSPGSSPIGWVKVFLSGYYQLWFGADFPEVLVLEMGVDKPGDMDYLLGIVRPHIAILTFIGSSHYEFFESEQAVLTEKVKLINAVPDDGYAVLNADNPLVLEQASSAPGKVCTYSSEGVSEAHVTASLKKEVVEIPPQTKLKIIGQRGEYPVTIQAVGVAHRSAIAAAALVAEVMRMGPEEITAGLADYRPVPGRLNLLKGTQKTLLIEDSYNASPDSMRSALQMLAKTNRSNKIAVLGDMLELGSKTEAAHREIGTLVATLKLDQLYAVGQSAKLIAEAAIAGGMDPGSVKIFENSQQAADAIHQDVITGSAIVIKGSRGVHLELVSRELLQEPMTASRVLPH